MDEKLLNLIGTNNKNRSAGGADYYVFAFLFEVLIVASQPRFCLVALVNFLPNQGIIGQAIGGAMLAKKEVAIDLSRLSLLKILIRF